MEEVDSDEEEEGTGYFAFCVFILFYFIYFGREVVI